MKFNNTILLLSFFCISIIFSSCTVQNRLYRPGLSIAWESDKNYSGIPTTYNITQNFGKQDDIYNNESLSDIIVNSEENIRCLASESLVNSVPLSKNHENEVPSVIYSVKKANSDSCDLIVMRSGDEIYALVRELTPTEVKYKRCDMPGGPMISINRNDILFIRYADGTKEVFKQEHPVKQAKTDYYHKSIHPIGILAIVVGLVGLIIFGIPLGILAVTLGISSISIIARESDRFYGRALSVIAIILGAFDVIGVLIYLSTL